MKDAVLLTVGEAAWQTPVNGDFARYVEELTGGQAQVTLDEPGRVRRVLERSAALVQPESKAMRAISHTPVAPGERHLRDAVSPRDAAAMRNGASAIMGKIRAGLLLLTLLQVALLAVLGWGSVAGVIASALIWWLVGRAKRVVDGADLHQVQQRQALVSARREVLARAAEQRKKERKT